LNTSLKNSFILLANISLMYNLELDRSPRGRLKIYFLF